MMIVKIVSVDRRNMIASCCKASDNKNSPRFFVTWKSRRFTPKVGDSYRANPVHKFVDRNDGSELVHGIIYETRSMEEKLGENRFAKN